MSTSLSHFSLSQICVLHLTFMQTWKTVRLSRTVVCAQQGLILKFTFFKSWLFADWKRWIWAAGKTTPFTRTARHRLSRWDGSGEPLRALTTRAESNYFNRWPVRLVCPSKSSDTPRTRTWTRSPCVCCRPRLALNNCLS